MPQDVTSYTKLQNPTEELLLKTFQDK